MQFLELRIPPPAVGFAIAGGMWGVSHWPPVLALADHLRWSLAAALAAVGIGVALAGILAFRRARTTVNPLRPEASTALVATGIYSLTRNPMYLGMLSCLLAVGVFLSSVWALLGPLLFALYITRFQIIPEELVLEKRFGSSFAAYRQRVRRWL